METFNTVQVQHQPLMNNVGNAQHTARPPYEGRAQDIVLETRQGFPTVRQKNEANKGPAGDLGES